MEFNGFTSMDFDFFRKKDKMSDAEYEKRRNEVKLHFRSLCYEIQKIYHKKTGGVLEMDKDFQSFNKRSSSIFVERPNDEGKSRLRIQMNSDGITVETYIQLGEDITPQKILNVFADNKNALWNYAMSGKNTIIYCVLTLKNNKTELYKLTSAEMNRKGYDSFSEEVSGKLEGCKGIRLATGYVYNKDECIKQSKAFQNIAYTAVVETMKLGGQIKIS